MLDANHVQEAHPTIAHLELSGNVLGLEGSPAVLAFFKKLPVLRSLTGNISFRINPDLIAYAAAFRGKANWSFSCRRVKIDMDSLNHTLCQIPNPFAEVDSFELVYTPISLASRLISNMHTLRSLRLVLNIPEQDTRGQYFSFRLPIPLPLLTDLALSFNVEGHGSSASFHPALLADLLRLIPSSQCIQLHHQGGLGGDWPRSMLLTAEAIEAYRSVPKLRTLYIETDIASEPVPRTFPSELFYNSVDGLRQSCRWLEVVSFGDQSIGLNNDPDSGSLFVGERLEWEADWRGENEERMRGADDEGRTLCPRYLTETC
jgi:hypothetical protein